jgi:hypothetical protein
VLGDEAQPAESDGPRDNAASGPRHAAPRKSLLTKLHVPAGKAVALAAMPTAVLMGMGFTPHLAQADEMPKNPFRPGPCVTQSDTPSPSATGTGTGVEGTKATPGTAVKKVAPKPSASPSPTGGGTAGGATPSVSPSGPEPTATATATTGAQPRSGTATAKPSVSPSPSPSASAASSTQSGPLDPLGLGHLIGGLLGGGAGTPAPAPPTPTPAPATTAPATTAPAVPVPTTTGPATGTGGGTTGGSTGSPGPTPSGGGSAPGTAKETVTGVGKTTGKAVTGLTGPTATPKPSGTATGGPAATGGKQAYPCPTYDAKALAGATVEPGIPALPDSPWILKTTKLTLYGLSYDGIVRVRTYNGTVKDVLKFTATGVDIENLHQIVDGPENTKTHVSARDGSTSTIRNGTVTMYTESLSGRLLGAIPVTFTPQAPPPLTLPVLFFTDVTVVQAGQFGGDLHVPGMHVVPGQSQ